MWWHPRSQRLARALRSQMSPHHGLTPRKTQPWRRLSHCLRSSLSLWPGALSTMRVEPVRTLPPSLPLHWAVEIPPAQLPGFSLRAGSHTRPSHLSHHSPAPLSLVGAAERPPAQSPHLSLWAASPLGSSLLHHHRPAPRSHEWAPEVPPAQPQRRTGVHPCGRLVERPTGRHWWTTGLLSPPCPPSSLSRPLGVYTGFSRVRHPCGRLTEGPALRHWWTAGPLTPPCPPSGLHRPLATHHGFSRLGWEEGSGDPTSCPIPATPLPTPASPRRLGRQLTPRPGGGAPPPCQLS